MEQELLTLPEHPSSPPAFSGVRVNRSLVLCVCFVDRCLTFCTFSFGHYVVLQYTASDDSFGIFKLFLVQSSLTLLEVLFFFLLIHLSRRDRVIWFLILTTYLRQITDYWSCQALPGRRCLTLSYSNTILNYRLLSFVMFKFIFPVSFGLNLYGL
jgi:hypothetical protein